MVDHDAQEQLGAVVALLREVLDDALLGVYPHGSTGRDDLRPTSDLDVLAVVEAAMTGEQRRLLLEGLLDVSGRRARVRPGRPVDLTVMRDAGLRAWRYPPPVEFQYGEWLRDAYESGFLPEAGEDADATVLLVSALAARLPPLHGPALDGLVDEVPAGDLRRATISDMHGLLAELEHDTRDVVLTLARAWTTLATGEVRSKDDAAEWALGRLPAGSTETMDVLRAARDDYRGGGEPQWPALLPAARRAADELIRRLEDAAR